MRISILLIALIASFSAFAGDRNLADKLVSTQGFEEVLDSSINSCLDEARKTDVEATLKMRPGLFGDIGPDSPVWDETRRAWISLVESNCYYTNKPKAMAAYSQAYTASMTNAEIESVLAFFRTPIGQTFKRASIAASIAGNKEAADTEVGDQAYKAYLLKIDDLMRKHSQLVSAPQAGDAR